jgi:hypothetical protein
MKPAWGNPAGLKIRSNDKEDNLFVVEFNFKQDMERALNGSPWLVGKHGVVLRDYDESLKPSEILLDRMDIWARIIDLPLGWMNKIRGEWAMGLIGKVRSMDVDKDGKASGPYLRARVSIELSKPIRRGIMLKAKKEVAPEWFGIQYEKLPYFCSSCGIMGHSHLECDKPLIRNVDGKLSYEVKPLRVPDTRRKKMQSFSDVAADMFGSAVSSTSKYPSRSANVQEAARVGECTNDPGREEEEVSSPLKKLNHRARAIHLLLARRLHRRTVSCFRSGRQTLLVCPGKEEIKNS